MESHDSPYDRALHSTEVRTGQPASTSVRLLWPTFLVATGHMVAGGAMTPLIPLYAVARGASPALVGVVAASASVLPLIFGVWAGAAADTLGPRRMVQVGALMHSASALLIAWGPGLLSIIAGAALAGLAGNVMIIAGQTSVAHVSRPAARDRDYGVFAFWVSVGQMLGPLAGGLLADKYSLQTAFYACAGVALAPFPAALWMASPARAVLPDAPSRPLRALEVYRAAWGLTTRRNLRFILWIAFLIIFAWSIKSSFLPLYLQSVDLSKAEIGLVFAFMGGGAMIVRPLVGALTGRFGRRQVLLGAVVLGTMVIAAIPALRGFWSLALLAAAGGVAWGITQPLTISLMAGSVQPHERGLALSLRITSNRLAEVVSPIAFGALVTRMGLGGAFVLAAAALGIGVVVIARAARGASFTHST